MNQNKNVSDFLILRNISSENSTLLLNTNRQTFFEFLGVDTTFSLVERLLSPRIVILQYFFILNY